ncbi:MAG TPA: acetyl-CoA C-acetyltransferase [Candidatus Latescibacteria bacterium]|nr:acetyl-CoA C-acetyltransferase [Candidatus Latescibacterota bacterium]
MQKAVIVSAVRTAVGRFGGALRDVSALDLGALVIKTAIERVGIRPDQVDKVVMGEVIQTTPGGNPAREAALKAGLPVESTAYTINMNCASGLKAIAIAMQEIMLGNGGVIVAGGMENMNQAPYLVEGSRWGYRLGDGVLVDMLATYVLGGMGEMAERMAEKYKISREEQDLFAFGSHQKALKAIEEGKFDDEIVPVEIPQRKGEPVVFRKDESPRPDTSPEKLAGLRPVFRKDGSVTPGNSCPINDGAAAVVLVSEEKAKELGLESIGTLKGWATCGVEPSLMGIGPVPATKKVLQETGITLQEIDLIELNEAFAAQALSVIQELGLKGEKVNVNGGAIALGHPIGATGAKLLTTLLYEMRRRDSRYGLVTMCIGGGQGIAVVVER